MTLGRWTSLGLALMGAGCLVGLYGVASHSSAAAATGRDLAEPILVVSQPAPTYRSAAQEAGFASAAIQPAAATATPAEASDDLDGIEPRTLAGAGMVANGSPAEGWMRRLNIGRELLRQGAEQSATMTFERIIGEAQICRAYQYALVDLAAMELYRGRTESARQLIDEADRSDTQLALDQVTMERIRSIRAELIVQSADRFAATY